MLDKSDDTPSRSLSEIEADALAGLPASTGRRPVDLNTPSVACTECNGAGWSLDHSDRHYLTGERESCEQAGCPEKRTCVHCGGLGRFEFNPLDGRVDFGDNPGRGGPVF